MSVDFSVERVKCCFSDQDIEFFEYGGEYPTQFLYLKSRFMAPDQEGYECAMPIKFWRRQA